MLVSEGDFSSVKPGWRAGLAQSWTAASAALVWNASDFEQQGFIKGVEGDRVLFDYRGMNQPLVDRVTVADVVWTSERLARIPDGHWQAAFTAAGYSPEITGRYIRKIKSKIAEGLALKAPLTN